MTITWQIFTEYIRLYFADKHKDVKKYGAEFLEQLDNIATADERYPIFYISPDAITMSENIITMNFVATCYDIIQKDRANTDTILSTTQAVLMDFYVWLSGASHIGLIIEVLDDATMIPVNNALLDYVAGWQMTLSINLPISTLCDIPGIG